MTGKLTNITFKHFWLITLICVVCFGKSQAQQKVQFTQYMFDGMVLNPAFAGANEALSLTFIHRSQWAGVEGSPKTQNLSAHTLFKKKQVGLGISVNNDQIGVHRYLNVLTNYAYHLKTGKNSYLSFGLQAGVHNRKTDYASLMEESDNDPLLTNNQITHTFFDFGAGIYFRSPRFHIGYSVPEMLPENIALSDSVSIRLGDVNNFLFAKYTIIINQNFDVEPGVLLKYLHGVPLSYDMNMNFIYRKILTMGISYRKNESVDFLMKGQITPQLAFGYAYDYPIGHITNFTNASHEVMIHYLFKYKQDDVVAPR